MHPTKLFSLSSLVFVLVGVLTADATEPDVKVTIEPLQHWTANGDDYYYYPISYESSTEIDFFRINANSDCISFFMDGQTPNDAWYANSPRLSYYIYPNFVRVYTVSANNGIPAGSGTLASIAINGDSSSSCTLSLGEFKNNDITLNVEQVCTAGFIFDSNECYIKEAYDAGAASVDCSLTDEALLQAVKDKQQCA